MSKLSLKTRTNIMTGIGMMVLFLGGYFIVFSESPVAPFGMAAFVGLGIGILLLTAGLKPNEDIKNRLKNIESKVDKIYDKLDDVKHVK